MMAPRSTVRTRVLIVDDEEDFATALAARLERRGFDCRFAFSGEEALAILKPDMFEVLLVDLKMPGMDGLALLRVATRIDGHCRVVVLTGHGSVSAGIEGMSIGAADFLQKPVDMDTLTTALEAAAHSSREARRAAEEGRA
jgi:DNA-binding NtrC family response regulator